MRLLGIDYGLKRVGLSLSYGYLADPLIVLINSKDLLVKICSICKKNEIEKIVIGLPGKSKMSKIIKQFGDTLKSDCRLPIVYWDETLTSIEAEKFSNKKTKTDALAAAIILQSYIDEKMS